MSIDEAPPCPEVAGPWMAFVAGEATELRLVYDEWIIREGDEVRLEPIRKGETWGDQRSMT